MRKLDRQSRRRKRSSRTSAGSPASSMARRRRSVSCWRDFAARSRSLHYAGV